MAQGYSLERISYLENQLHLAPYQRNDAWQKASEADMREAIRIAKTARTLVLNSIAKWADRLTLEETENALPDVWNNCIQQVRQEGSPAPAYTLMAEDDPSPRVEDPMEAEPIDVLKRPAVPDDAPRSQVTPPEQLNLGHILAKIEVDNSQT